MNGLNKRDIETVLAAIEYAKSDREAFYGGLFHSWGDPMEGYKTLRKNTRKEINRFEKLRLKLNRLIRLEAK